MHCECRFEYTIARLDGNMEPIRCKSLAEIIAANQALRERDPEGVKRGEYSITHKSSYYEPL